MIIKEITSSEAEAVLFEPEIWERIKVSDEKPKLPDKNTIYLGGFIDRQLFGVVIYYIKEKITTCHIQVIKKYRGLAVEFGKKALMLSPSKVLYTNIPNKYKDVAKFAKYFGFLPIRQIQNQIIYRRG